MTNVLPTGGPVTFAIGAFNGYRFSDENGTIPDITGVTINPDTNLAGFDASRIFFDANTVRINIAPNTTWALTEVVSLDVTFASPTATPTATATSTPTVTPTPTPTLRATSTASPTPTPTATATTQPMGTPTATATPADTIPTLDWRGLALLSGLLLLFGVIGLKRIQS